MKFKIMERIAEFEKRLLNDIPKTYDVQLRGSWSTQEFHASLYHQGLISFSDIDYASDPLKIEYIQHALRESVHKAAGNTGIQLLGNVSIRCRNELDLLWRLPANVGDDQDRQKREDYVCFWSLIACAETALAYETEFSVQGWERYQIVKFFLRLWRTLAIADGWQVNSWAETLNYAAQRISLSACQSTLRIKRGHGQVDDWPAFVEAHSTALIQSFFWVNYRHVVAMITEITSQSKQELIRQFPYYLDLAKPFASSSASRRSALVRLHDKGRK